MLKVEDKPLPKVIEMAKKQKDSTTLIEALKFISLAQRNTGSPLTAFCQLSDGFATSCDGILTASHKIEEDLEARPHTKKFISALSNCGKNLSITQLENNVLAIKSGRFFANVPCHDADEISKFVPDNPTIFINNVIKEGFKHIQHLSKDEANETWLSSVLLKSGSMFSTNEVVILEYWHGIEELPTLIIPKSFCSAVCRIDKNLVLIGYSNSSVTFWFEDESWIKTQLFAEQWPDIEPIFRMPEIAVIDLPRGFFKAISSVEDFATDGKEKGHVFLSKFGISTHKNHTEGASYNIKGLNDLCVNIRQLKNIESSCNQIAMDEHRMFFFGDKVRGICMGIAG